MAADKLTPAAVAVVLCTRDRPELLADALPALVAARDAGADVVVVDSASRGPETRELTEQAGLRLVRCERPGASHARNAGTLATSAPVLVFTDDDCRPRPGWDRALATAFADPTIGFATGRVLPGTGSGRAMSPMVEEEATTWTVADDVAEMGHGANMAFRRSALEAVHGFDEHLGAGVPLRGSEDKDAFLRVLRAGWRGQYVPESVVEHAAWRGQRASLRNAYWYGLGSGARAVKTARVDGAKAGPLVRGSARRCLRQAWAELRSGHRFATANLTLRATGILVGGARASRYDLRDELFQSR
jgi:glycosyltransferase involved in cell wall biosynthesis